MLYELAKVDLAVVVEVNLSYNVVKLLTCRPRTSLIFDQIADLSLVDEAIVVGVEERESFS